jgi:pimeloyl-ACP methyl ester carboxylesterase
LRGGDGPPLLFLHAAGGAGTWHPFHAALARSFDVIAPDHPGMGRSDDFDEFSGVDDLAYHYLELLDRLGLESATLVGGSFGAWVAAEVAVLAPQRVEKLVLIAPPGLRIPEHPITDIFLMTPEQRLAAIWHDPSRAPVSNGFDQAAFLQAYRDMAAVARFAWVPFMADLKLERRLSRVTAPTLVIAAGEDQVIPRAHCERYAERISGARLEVVEDCGHALYFEQPDAIADAVSAFLGADLEASR